MFNKIYDNIIKFIKNNFIYLIIIVLIILLDVIKLPYTIYAPGGIIDINSRLSNIKYNSNGNINMTYVSSIDSSVFMTLVALINPKWDLVSNDDIISDNETIEDEEIRSKIDLKSSISNAISVAYEYANEELNIIDSKCYIIYVSDKASSLIKVGDEIVSIDNNKISSFDDIKNYISNLNVGNKVNLLVKRNNEEINIETIIYEDEDNNPKIGIAIDQVNEYDNNTVKYDYNDNESGPSGGTMLTLAIYNSLVEEDVTNGKNICGTGTIDIDGNVGSIGGVKYKLEGAVNNKCDVFYVPTDNYEEAINVKEEYNYDINIIKVNNFKEVLENLS